MTDPLSITASIVAIVQISALVLQSLGNFKDASQDLRRLRAEIEYLHNVVLPRLESVARLEEKEPNAGHLLEARDALEEFRRLLEHLKEKLAPAAGFNKARRAMTWQFRKGEIRSILSTIERQKSMFVLVLQSETYARTYDTSESVAELRKDHEATGSLFEPKQVDGIWGPVIHHGNNHGGSNVVYGGTQIFSGATIFFGNA